MKSLNTHILFVVFSLIVLLGSFLRVLGQEQFINRLHFQYLTADEGLAQNTVDCILKDSRGFMWFGTWNGLCSYDGYSFRTFQKEKDKNGLPDNFVHTLVEDSLGNLWIGTSKGIVIYRFSTDNFYQPSELLNVFQSSIINHMAIEKEGAIWVSTENKGLWKINFCAQDFTFEVKQVNPHLLLNQPINYCYQLMNESMLVATNQGLVALNTDSETLDNSLHTLTETIGNETVLTVYQAFNGEIWIGTDIGLYRYLMATGSLFFYSSSLESGSLSHNNIMAIAEDKNNNLLIGTLGGLNFYNRQNDNFIVETIEAIPGEGLNNEFINSLCTDKLGNVWIGTEKGGINKYNLYDKPFFSYKNHPANLNSISHNTINSVLKEKDVLWVGTAGGGLNRISEINQKIDKFIYEEGSTSSLSSDFITSIVRHSKHGLFVGSWGGGINKLISTRQKSFEQFVHNELNENSICNNFVSSLIENKNGNLIIGTVGGFDEYNLDEKNFLHVHNMLGLRQRPPEVGCLLIDQNGHLWVGTRKGLYRFYTSTFSNYKPGEQIRYDFFVNSSDDLLSLPGDYVISLKEDHNGTIWIGTYGSGICKYVPSETGKGDFVNYTESDGLCNNVVYAIEEDLQGNLWISTDKGLSKFNPRTKEFQNFYVKDGLLSDQFYWSASESSDDGYLYFGGILGLNYFKPEEIKLYPEFTKPVFTDFRVFNNSVTVGEKYHSKVILEKAISEIEKVELSYHENVFSIEFSALDYFLPEKIKYAYKMEGVDQDWVIVPASRRFANYTNLSGGEYIFKVKASNNDGIWKDDFSQLKIIIYPPFWLTTWFKIACVLFVILAVMGYIRYRVQFLRMQKKKLEKQVKERTEKIEEQKEELRKQNEKIVLQRDEVIVLNEKVSLINKLRLRFFTNISHEFRTPLTLIIDPLEQLAKNLKGDKQTHQTLSMINRNAQRLLHLINQLMYFRRIETGQMKVRVGKGNLNEFLKNIFESFHDLADHQKIDYQFLIKDSLEEVWFDAEKLENVFFNLLSNAFKFTPENGAIKMSVFLTNGSLLVEEEKSVEIKIEDSGCGISANDLPHIFDRFYQAYTPQSGAMKGSGIGLALTSEIIEALHGTIKVESQLGKGSVFTVALPTTIKSFSDSEIDYDAYTTSANIRARVDVIIQDMIIDDEEIELNQVTNSDKSKPFLLIVEDNFDLRTFLIQSMKSSYRVIGTDNGKDALALAKKYSPDIIVSDVMMPIMDGIEFCSRLKKDIQTSHIPIILLTAKAMLENWVEGMETGADDYIPKPFNLQVLQVKMNSLIDSRRKLKRLFCEMQHTSPAEITSNSVDEEFISRAYAVLEKNYIEPEFSASQFASEMFVSRSLLYKKIKAITDLNITDFINSYKLKKAIDLIKESNKPISDIAFSVGFNDPKYFSRIFKKFYGMSPTEFYLKS